MKIFLWVIFGFVVLSATGAFLAAIWNTAFASLRVNDWLFAFSMLYASIALYSYNTEVKKLERRTWLGVFIAYSVYLAYQLISSWTRGQLAVPEPFSYLGAVAIGVFLVFHGPIVYVMYRLTRIDLKSTEEQAALGRPPEFYQPLADQLFEDTSIYEYSVEKTSADGPSRSDLIFAKEDSVYVVKINVNGKPEQEHRFTTLREAVKQIEEQTVFRVSDFA